MLELHKTLDSAVFTDRFSGTNRANGPVCVCVCVCVSTGDSM